MTWLFRLLKFRRQGVFVLVALFALALAYGIYQRGYNAAEGEAQARENQSEIETGRAIDEAPVFSHSDPIARRLLCQLADRPDCSDL